MSFNYIKKKKKIGIGKKIGKLMKNLQVHLKSFFSLNVDTKKRFFFSNLKIFTSPSYEFLLQRYSEKMHKSFLMTFSDKHDDRRTAVWRYSGTAVQRYKPTYIYPPR